MILIINCFVTGKFLEERPGLWFGGIRLRPRSFRKPRGMTRFFGRVARWPEEVLFPGQGDDAPASGSPAFLTNAPKTFPSPGRGLRSPRLQLPDFMTFSKILTHPGGSHKDEFLACCLLLADNAVPVVRREPTDADLADASIAVVDVGHEHDASRGNFDHHQFPKDHPPTCSLSLVLQHLGIYEDALAFCDWLEPAEWFDTRGPVETAKWLGVERETLFKLNSPIDTTLLRRFAAVTELNPGEPLWEVMRWIGGDLLAYLKNLRTRLDFIGQVGEFWEIEAPGGPFKVLYLPRTEPLPDEPSAGLARFIDGRPDQGEIAGLVYPDRRGTGYGLSRHNDHPDLDFTRIQDEEDVHFAHARGFVAKTSASDPARLRELLAASWR